MRRRADERDAHAAAHAQLQRTPAALAGDRQRRLHRLAPGRALLELGRRWSASTTSPPGTRQSRRGRARVGAATWQRHRFIEATFATSQPAATPAKASTSCCTRPRWARCRARSRTRCAPTPPTSTGFLNMLVAARDAGVERFVYAASSSTYGDHPGLPKVEDAIGRPLSPYAVTKLRQRALCRRVRPLLRHATIGLRYFNVFGARQDPEGAYAAVIPRWMRAMLARRAGRRSTATARPAATSATSTTSCRRTCWRRRPRIRRPSTRSTTSPSAAECLCGNSTTRCDPCWQHSIRALRSSYRATKISVPVMSDIRKPTSARPAACSGFDPAFDVRAGLACALPWYAARFAKPVSATTRESLNVESES